MQLGVRRDPQGTGDFLVEIWRYPQDAFLAFTMVRLCYCLASPPAAAENAVRIDPAQGPLLRFTRPFRARPVPPVNLANTLRLESLIHAGNLYLSAQDAVALAVENNLDIEVQRYGPLLAQEVLRRARAGGALRNVGVGVAAGPSSVSLTGVTVTNIGAVGAAGEGVSSGGGIVTQLGPAHLIVRSHSHSHRKRCPYHQPAKQHHPDRNHRPDPAEPHLSSGLQPEPGTSA